MADLRGAIEGLLEAFDGEVPKCQVIIPDFGIVEGPFQITSLEYSGSHNGEATYEIALASAGALNFVAL